MPIIWLRFDTFDDNFDERCAIRVHMGKDFLKNLGQGHRPEPEAGRGKGDRGIEQELESLLLRGLRPVRANARHASEWQHKSDHARMRHPAPSL